MIPGKQPNWKLDYDDECSRYLYTNMQTHHLYNLYFPDMPPDPDNKFRVIFTHTKLILETCKQVEVVLARYPSLFLRSR